MSPAPLLSIGVPVYNGERYLAAALDSALWQEYAPMAQPYVARAVDPNSAQAL